MDVAYDHITDEALAPAEEGDKRAKEEGGPSGTLNTEFQEAFKAVSASPWGATLGGWFGEARKQGQAFYTDLQKEASEAQESASKRIGGLREQLAKTTGNLSFNTEGELKDGIPGEEVVPKGEKSDEQMTPQNEHDTTVSKPESLSADIVKEAGTLVASLRSTAAARLKDLQHAEDAADEALLKFGSNVRKFLREAVVITAPSGGDPSRARDAHEVLFETQEPGTGKKVFHATRLDAQLHAIHTNTSAFSEDPEGDRWQQWQEEFDIDKRTDVIADDLEKYTELRGAMEKLVPEKVEYKAFWMRYYFLRKAVEEEEKKRKEVLKAADAQETVGWDDDDEEESPTPNAERNKFSASTTTLNAPASNDLLKPKSPRRSHEEEIKSVADSDASYDIVSGATSRAPGSPKDEKKGNGEESDDDWE